jgi:two-component system, OmpR family, sensor histidine kinase KdpD
MGGGPFMKTDGDTRPDAEALLKEIEREEGKKGRLKIFLGYAPGVGKTYAMLQEARVLRSRGVDVVAGVVETHKRSETESLLTGLDVVPTREMEYEGIHLRELDVDAVLRRSPSIVLVDELAHTNAPGSRHPKRYQDVEELLENGIDVYTTVNIQHFESQVDTVSQITGIRVQETVPDRVLEGADEVQVIDIPLEELSQRLKEGKVYVPERARKAMESFFQRGNLVALRELTLTLAARKMGTELVNYMRAKAITGPWAAGERIMVCIAPSPFAPQLLRKAYNIARDANAEWYAVHVSPLSSKELSERDRLYLTDALNLAEELGAKTVTLTGNDIVEEIRRFAGDNNITTVIVGRPLHSRFVDFFKNSPVHRLLHAPEQFEIHLVTPIPEKGIQEKGIDRAGTGREVSFNVREYLVTAAMVAGVTAVDLLLERLIDPHPLVFVYLIATLTAALRSGIVPSLFASVLSLLAFDFVFTEPHYSFSMYHASDVLSAVIFFMISLAVGQLANRAKRQNSALQRRLLRVTLIEEMSKEFFMLPPVEQLIGGFGPRPEEWKGILPLLRTTVLDDVSRIIIRYAIKVVDTASFVLFAGQDGKLRVWSRSREEVELDAHEMAVAQWAFDHGEIAGAGTQTLSNARVCFIPMKSGDEVVGVLGVQYEYKDLLVDQRRLLGSITSLAALGSARWAGAA